MSKTTIYLYNFYSRFSRRERKILARVVMKPGLKQKLIFNKKTMSETKTQNKMKDILETFTEKFPILEQAYELYGSASQISKDQENTLRKSTEITILEILELIVLASRQGRDAKRLSLITAGGKVDTLKVFADMAKDLKLIAADKADELIANYNGLGRMLGGWIKALKAN